MLSLVLFYCDRHFEAFKALHHFSLVATHTIQRIVNWPVNSSKLLTTVFIDRQSLVDENLRLQNELLIAYAKMQQLAFVKHENIKLRELLNGKKNIQTRFQVAELLHLVIDRFDHRFTINRGQRDGVYIGQPVLNAQGLVGQITLVQGEISRVMPITDKKSAIPITVLKNGLQLIALGTGNRDFLELVGATVTADVREGDLLVTSGVGGVFPAGYPVGVIHKIEMQSTERFLKILATPYLKVDSSPYLLLVWYKSGDK